MKLHLPNEMAMMVAAGASVVVASACLYTIVSSSGSDSNNSNIQNKKKKTVLVFQDNGDEYVKTSGLSPNAFAIKYDPSLVTLKVLKMAIAEALITNIGEGVASNPQDGLRLWVQATKEEVTDANLSKVLLLRRAEKNGVSVVVLICTLNGSPLSETASSSVPLERFPLPLNVPELPLGLGHILGYIRGKNALQSWNAYDNFFRGSLDIKSVRIRPFPYKPDDVLNMEYYDIDYRPYQDEGLILTTDPDMVQELLDRQADFPKMWTSYRERRVKSYTGDGGLFTDSTTSKHWQTAHGVLPKYFNAIRMKHYFPLVLEKTQVFVKEWTKLGNGATISDAVDWLTCMTADAVVKATMDYDMQNVERKGAKQELHRFLIAFRKTFSFDEKQSPTKAEVEEYERQYKICQDVVWNIVESTRAGEMGGPLSFITAMLENKSTTNGEYVEFKTFWGHCINVMVAGHETTAATLGFCMAELARHPECLKKAIEEIERVMGSRSSPTYEDISKLHYIEACFREALRMYPAVQALKRECANDTIVLGKYLLRKGQRIETLSCGLHRRPEQWDQGGVFGNTDVFNPERHMPGAPARHACAYAPFGFGVRSCIGFQFALLEAKTFLCMVLNFFNIQTPPNFEIVPVQEGGAPTCRNLTYILNFREGGPLSRLSLFSGAALSEDVSSKPASVVAPTTKPVKATTALAAESSSSKNAGKPILILYGSNSGTCEDFARMLSDKSNEEGYENQVISLDKALSDNMLPFISGPVAIVTSTYNGTPPDNATKFAKWLASAQEGSLKDMHFAVFGLGNSSWEVTYQKFPSEVHSGLDRAGATQLKELTTADVNGSDFADVFEDWATKLLLIIGLDSTTSMATTTKPMDATKKRATLIRDVDPASLNQGVAKDEAAFKKRLFEVFYNYMEKSEEMRNDKKPRFKPCEVTKLVQLQSEHSGRSTCHLELLLPDGATYEAGDHLAVTGCNSDEMVTAALEALGMTGEEVVECIPARVAYERGFPDDLPGVPVVARVALKWLPNLYATPSRKDLERLADACPCPNQSALLRSWCEEANYRDKVVKKSLTLPDILSNFKSARMDIVEFFAALPRLKPRYYSISSSPMVKPNRVSITVGLVEFETQAGQRRRGVASGMIHSLTVGSFLLGKVCQLNGKFRLPEDSTTPIIMIGPGTGVAPFMGFLEERDVLSKTGRKLGPAHLFFGCRSSNEDYIYKDILEGYAKNGVLSANGLHVAFSREERKVYVQDLIGERSAEIWELIAGLGAVVYICGDAKRMAPDVKRAVVNVATTHGQLTQAAAENWMGELISSGRYVEDVYA